ncbi:MAG: S24/S26 family peptidase [Clostridiales bacterium]|nr:S24/S26 family peptidase [Clostridiales bacterium]
MSKSITLDQAYGLILETLENDGRVSFVSTGNSMYPTIRDRKDTIYLAKPDRPLRKFDIIFYRRDDGKFVLHRIVGKNKDGYILCGDNQIVKEYGIRPDQVIALLKEFEKDGKRINCDSFSFRLKSRFMPEYKSLKYVYSKILEKKNNRKGNNL